MWVESKDRWSTSDPTEIADFLQEKEANASEQDDPNKKRGEKSNGIQFWDGFVAGLEDLAKGLAPIRPLEEGEPKTIGEVWNTFKEVPDNIYDIYSNGSLEEKTRLTTGLLGLLRGKKSNIPNVAIKGAANGSKLLYFGKIAVSREHFHRVIKKNILSNVGDFVKKVGNNPDVKVVGDKIQLTGTGPFKGKTFQTNLKATDYLK
ncbi:hypothetical protein GCM10023231_18930 [Olivibacter ginsenosidimutans]|uniref:Uncharacterized protein n=2 Tax=Olivibacter ginsenosidimutans TaxID=1176537 RepID=A0ABP9B665_9SPHI